jgi:UDP-glucose 4-epimerase
MKFFIPGGAGYIGTHISSMLIDNGHDVVILDNFSNSSISSIYAIEKLVNRQVTFYKGDICDHQMLLKIFESHKFNAVIHLAALKSVAESILKPKEYYQNNVGGTLSLLEVMRSFDLKNLIFSSSATVYGIPQYLPIDESHPLSSTNPYANTKLEIEKILQEISTNDKGWSIVSLRYFNPVGAHESHLIGDSPRNIPNNLMPYLVSVANKELPHLNIYGNDYDTDDGTGIRDYIHVMDLAESHLIAMNFIGIKTKNNKLTNPSNLKTGFNFFNIGTGKGCSVLELVKIFEQVNGVEIPYVFAPRRPGDVPSCYANVDKSHKSFQWIAERSIEEMCQSAWNYKKYKNYGK